VSITSPKLAKMATASRILQTSSEKTRCIYYYIWQFNISLKDSDPDGIVDIGESNNLYDWLSSFLGMYKNQQSLDIWPSGVLFYLYSVSVGRLY